jgi:hypothetical protein
MNRAEKLRQKKLADKALKLMQTVSPDIAEQQQTLAIQQAIGLTNTRKLKIIQAIHVPKRYHVCAADCLVHGGVLLGLSFNTLDKTT